MGLVLELIEAYGERSCGPSMSIMLCILPHIEYRERMVRGRVVLQATFVNFASHSVHGKLRFDRSALSNCINQKVG